MRLQILSLVSIAEKHSRPSRARVKSLPPPGVTPILLHFKAPQLSGRHRQRTVIEELGDFLDTLRGMPP